MLLVLPPLVVKKVLANNAIKLSKLDNPKLQFYALDTNRNLGYFDFILGHGFIPLSKPTLDYPYPLQCHGRSRCRRI